MPKTLKKKSNGTSVYPELVHRISKSIKHRKKTRKASMWTRRESSKNSVWDYKSSQNQFKNALSTPENNKKHYRIVATIEGHGSILTTKKKSKKGGFVGQNAYIPKPNFHLHRTGIVMCGTLYYCNPEDQIQFFKDISSELENIKRPIIEIIKDIETKLNATQIENDINNEKYGFLSDLDSVAKTNVNLGSVMRKRGIPGILTEYYYGEKKGTLLANKVFSGREENDDEDLFIKETTKDGPAIYFFAIETVDENGNIKKRKNIGKAITLKNDITMNDFPEIVRNYFTEIGKDDVIDFFFIDNSCNFNDIKDDCSTLSLITQVTKEKMVEMYKKHNGYGMKK